MSLTVKQFVLATFSLVLIAHGASAASATATIAWDPNPETDVVGYKVSWGTQHAVYPSSVAVGNVSSYTFTSLVPGLTYYFAVQALNSSSLLSPYSNEVAYSVPVTTRVAGDFSGDGKAEITVFRPSTGKWWVLQSNGGYQTSGASGIGWGTAGDVPVAGDYDGDGKMDPGVWRPSNGMWYILLSSKGYSAGSCVQLSWGGGQYNDVPVPADYDGDGKTDIAVWRPGDGTWFVLPSSHGYAYSSYFKVGWGVGSLHDVPVPGDYDGDGRADIAVWRPGSGTWFILPSAQNYAYSSYFQVGWGVGSLRDVPVPADYDGDGRTDIAVWRPGDGTWFVLPSSHAYSYSSYFQVGWGVGSLNDVPVPADYDGDGRADIAVWRPGDGNWFVLPSAQNYSYGSYFRVNWGSGALGDKPIMGR